MDARALSTRVVLQCVIACSAVTAATGALAAEPSTAKKTAVPRTADGKPDFGGFWTHETITPYERPAAYGERIDGIIGYSFFSRYIVKINYDSSRLQVYSKGSMKYPRGGFLLRPVLSTLPIQAGRINDSREINSRFYFDTGAGLCLLLSEDFVEDSGVLRPKTKPVLTQGEGLGGKMEMKLTTIKEFKLGPYKFKKVPTYIFNDTFNVTAYPYLGGLIGNDILRRFNVTINYDRRDIYLVPNTRYRDPFDYSYTGLGIYKIDTEVIVIDIMKGSPAEKAGFQPGDVILAMNSNFSRNIQTYKSLLQNVGEKIRVLVLREGSPQMITLKVGSILKRKGF